MNRYFELSTKVAENLNGTFLQILIPILTAVGPIIFFYFGYKGIIKRETISLYRFRGRSVSQSSGTITGVSAIIVGSLYLITGVIILAALGGVSFTLLLSF